MFERAYVRACVCFICSCVCACECVKLAHFVPNGVHSKPGKTDKPTSRTKRRTSS